MNPLDKILPAAKSWAALLGAIVTALLGTVGPDDTLGQVLTALAAVLTAVAVYRVPNADAPDDRGAGELLQIAIVTIGVTLGLALWYLLRMVF